MAGSIQPDVVEFIFEQGRRASERQLRDAESLDAKATQLFSAATVIVGLAGFSGRSNAGVLTVAVALYALWLAKYRVTDSPAQLLERYWNDELNTTKYAMVVDMADGFEENEAALGRKRRGVLAVLFFTGVETAVAGAAVIDSLWG